MGEYPVSQIQIGSDSVADSQEPQFNIQTQTAANQEGGEEDAVHGVFEEQTNGIELWSDENSVFESISNGQAEDDRNQSQMTDSELDFLIDEINSDVESGDLEFKLLLQDEEV